MKHIKIVRNDGSELTAAALRQLADKADMGDLIGVAVAVVRRDRSVSSYLGGLCMDNSGMALKACAKMFNSILNQP
jgi:hypothetical protein